MKIFSLFLKSSPITFIAAIITGVLSGVTMTYIIKTIQEALRTNMAEPEMLVVKFLFVWVGYGVTSFLSVKIITRLSEEAVLDLRKMVSEKILKVSFQSMEMERNKLFTILTNDITTISNGVNRLPNVITAISMILGCVVYMGFISIELFGMFAVLLVIAFFFYKMPMNAYRWRIRESRGIQNQLFGYFEALIYGLKELALSKNLRKSFKEDVLFPACEDQRDYNMNARIRLTFISKWGEMLLLLGLGAMLFVVFSLGVSSFESFGEFLTVALFLIPALQRFSNFLPQLGKVNVALEQIEEVGFTLDQYSEPEHEDIVFVEKEGEPLVSLREVTFSYFHADEKKFFQLGPISLDINRGEIVYLIGGNGSGKSTLAKVLCGLYEPETGQRYYGGNEIDSTNIDEYREHYSAIFFDFYLFEHLHHVKSDFWREKAQKYLELLELDRKVKIEDDKLSTTSLSTGQRKRLVLLLSLLEDKPMYLFDEWAASQDPYYKNVFYKTILPDMKAMGKTIFVITHDEQYFDCADRILLLQEGKLVKENLPKDIISFYIREKVN
ncbi:cyclic peptide export ABC transporter [Marinoscillum sp. MHG1-6]|uniref:cyclic peptide export ABC transporter n=1 Tax=Marinoscillum sp. MHG1-6 TaxID=2959627 RepID=UPI002157DF91|nr:cyclic peptide export ABC transporter [Marinoscillum sp. MHG1-6]